MTRIPQIPRNSFFSNPNALDLVGKIKRFLKDLCRFSAFCLLEKMCIRCLKWKAYMLLNTWHSTVYPVLIRMAKNVWSLSLLNHKCWRHTMLIPTMKSPPREGRKTYRIIQISTCVVKYISVLFLEILKLSRRAVWDYVFD